MTFEEVAILFITGLVAGFINACAGGGSVLTLPVLILLGLPAAVANATNRVAIIMIATFGFLGYRSKGVGSIRYNWKLALAALPGALLGAYLAVNIEDQSFERFLAVAILLVTLVFAFKNKLLDGFRWHEKKHSNVLIVIVFALLGIYGGFIQAGAGILFLIGVSVLRNYTLSEANSTKLLVVGVYTIGVLALFAFQGKVLWNIGIVLGLGSALGGWMGSRWASRVNEKWIKILLIGTVIVLSIQLWTGHHVVAHLLPGE